MVHVTRKGTDCCHIGNQFLFIVLNIFCLFVTQSEPFDDVVTYKGDIIVGLKFVPPDSSSTSQHSSPHSSGGLSLRKFGSIKSSPSSRSSSSKGSLHVLVKEGKNLNAVKANGFCDAFCKR